MNPNEKMRLRHFLKWLLACCILMSAVSSLCHASAQSSGISAEWLLKDDTIIVTLRNHDPAKRDRFVGLCPYPDVIPRFRVVEFHCGRSTHVEIRVSPLLSGFGVLRRLRYSPSGGRNSDLATSFVFQIDVLATFSEDQRILLEYDDLEFILYFLAYEVVDGELVCAGAFVPMVRVLEE